MQPPPVRSHDPKTNAAKSLLIIRMAFLALLTALGQAPAVKADPAAARLLIPERIFDGEKFLADRAVLIGSQGRISAVGPAERLTSAHPDVPVRRLNGVTLLPGLIEGHSHVLLHPYDETPWNDQVLKESRAERVVRAVTHLKASLAAGFTTLRDLGTEGAGYADVGLRTALEKGVIAGPRLIVVGPAMVVTGSYGPKGFAPNFRPPLGAEEADETRVITVARDQIGHGIDWVKVYADYRWGPNGATRPTFSRAELQAIVATARDAGLPVAAHASSIEGMRRATLAGVRSIEHGDAGTREIFALMAEHGVFFCPTLAAGEAIARYRGWHKGRDPAPERVRRQHSAFAAARGAGVKICAGSDAGVFRHGDNTHELELMVEYGMSPTEALHAATAVNAEMLNMADRIGRIAPGMAADLVAVRGNPGRDIGDLREVVAVWRDGVCVAASCP
ncbi:MAG: amidohydrolase family protein [Alphaproteobacteria bacterium]|nr:MAG: amidohydrolase family protein [Alphaproteobacteria bacterium]